MTDDEVLQWLSEEERDALAACREVQWTHVLHDPDLPMHRRVAVPKDWLIALLRSLAETRKALADLVKHRGHRSTGCATCDPARALSRPK